MNHCFHTFFTITSRHLESLDSGKDDNGHGQMTKRDLNHVYARLVEYVDRQMDRGI